MGLGFLVTEMSQEFVLSAYVRIWDIAKYSKPERPLETSDRDYRRGPR